MEAALKNSSEDLIRMYDNKRLAEEYIKYRPEYPQFILKCILEYMDESCQKIGNTERFSKLVDVGCGSGQATRMFAEYFESITAIDISENQIKVANMMNICKNISYQLVHDNYFPVASNSVDLVICATAAHWLNINTFESECDRVLKPGGCVAIYTYLIQGIITYDDKYIDNLQSKFFEIILKFINDCKGHSRSKLKGYQELYDEISNISKHWVSCPDIDKEYDLTLFKKFMSTLGEYPVYMESNPTVDPLEEFGDSIQNILCQGSPDEQDVKFKITFGHQLILFRK